METRDFRVKLFDMTSFAADGSNIPRRSCEEYLRSVDYETIIRDKVAIGGLTHKDRKLNQNLKGLVGMDDQVLINNNSTHYITSIFTTDSDNFLYATARTFNPNNFAGEKKENITNLIGFLDEGVKFPISVVIQALWSKRNVAERIIRIKGFDFTQNPSFKGAGDVQVLSESAQSMYSEVEGLDETLKTFSASIESGDLTLATKVFSSDGTVCTIIDAKDQNSLFSDLESGIFLTKDDILNKYGRFSDQFKVFSDLGTDSISSDELKNIKTPEEANEALEKASKFDDTQSLSILGRKSGSSSLNNLISNTPPVEYDNDDLDHQIEEVSQSTDSFSSVGSIANRTVVMNQPRYTKIQRLIDGYQDYWNSKPLSKEIKVKVQMMFLQDINLLIKEVLSEIYNNRSLVTLYGLSRFSQDVRTTGMELSTTYRKLMISEKVMGFVPKSLYGEWVSDMRSFYQAMLIYTFGEGLDDLHLNILDYKTL